MMKLLITDNIDEIGLEPLEKHFKIEKRLGLSPAKLQTIIADYHILITRSSTPVPENVIKKTRNLKLICRAGIGVDNIDIFAATKAGIGVINAPQSNALVTAEHTIGLIFSLLRHIPAAAADLKKGIWGKQKYLGSQIQGKVLGIVGFGNVGREVYRMAVGVGMKVVVCEPYTQLPRRVKKLTYEELLRESDIISFHVPLTYLTTKMINRHTVNLCKKGAYLVNCSRGGVVDDEAVIRGIKDGHLQGFAVDVFTNEPSPNPKLLKLDQVIATPHIAGSTLESQKESIKE
ncbi:phosphoglycerate dehydrogenase, partial [Candidatus Gottesmanbacteria bacterium]|nr:phosphoglycerate dehydrogenase [Candidatus Gottesmanbacteria bacterium]